MTNRLERDHNAWNANPPELPEGWVRYPLHAYTDGENFWDAVPDYAEEEGLPILVEYRQSRIMGYGIAAVWIGPKED